VGSCGGRASPLNSAARSHARRHGRDGRRRRGRDSAARRSPRESTTSSLSSRSPMQQRHLSEAPSLLCGRRFTHPRRPTQFDALGYLVADTCVFILPTGHATAAYASTTLSASSIALTMMDASITRRALWRMRQWRREEADVHDSAARSRARRRRRGGRNRGRMLWAGRPRRKPRNRLSVGQVRVASRGTQLRSVSRT
jgi:hypothetical protein